MYVVFKMVNDGQCDYPEDIKVFNNNISARKYVEYAGNGLCIEEARECGDDYEIYDYLHVYYIFGSDHIIHEFKTVTSLDKNKDEINEIHVYGDSACVDISIRNKKDGYKKLSKIIEALDSIYMSVSLHNCKDDNIVQHNVGVVDIDKEEFFNLIK